MHNDEASYLYQQYYVLLLQIWIIKEFYL